MQIHKISICFWLIFNILNLGISNAQNPALPTDSSATIKVLRLENGDSAIVYAKKFIGTHYKYAGNSPETGFDCSGFVNYVFKRYNITLPRSSKDFDNGIICASKPGVSTVKQAVSNADKEFILSR